MFCIRLLFEVVFVQVVCVSHQYFLVAGVQRHSDLVRLRILQRLHLLVWKLLSWPGIIFAVTKYCGIKYIKQFSWLMLMLMNTDYCLDQVTFFTWNYEALLIPTHSRLITKQILIYGWFMFLKKDSCSWLLFYKVSSWDGCPGVCHMPCNWDTEVLIFNKVSIGIGIFLSCNMSQWSLYWWPGVLRHGSGWQRMLAGQLLHVHRVWWMSFHYRSCDFDEEYEKDTEKDNKDETDTDNKLGLVTRAKKWGRGIFSFRCPTSRSDFEMTNKINNDKLKKNLFVKPLTKTLPLLGSGSDYGSGASGAGTCFEPYTQVSILSHLQQRKRQFWPSHNCYKLSPHKTSRSATALRSTATLDMTLTSAGTETTASTRYNLYPLGWIFFTAFTFIENIFILKGERVGRLPWSLLCQLQLGDWGLVILFFVFVFVVVFVFVFVIVFDTLCK